VWSHAQSDARQGAERRLVETGGDGRFRIESLHPDARFVFAEKAGHRLRGALISPLGQEARIVLPTFDAPAEPLRSIRRTAAEKRRLLNDLIRPVLPALRESESDYFTTEALKYLGPYDRELVLGELDKLSSDSSRIRLLIALGELEDALELAALGKDPGQKAYQVLSAVDASPDVAFKKRLLTEAIVDARRIERPESRVLVLAGIAERLYELGDKEAARALLEEGQKFAAQLARVERSGYARGVFAETLALFDPDAAMQLVTPLKDARALTRHMGNIAHELANIDPAESERFLKLIQRDSGITPYYVRVCYRMAPVDLDRASRIAAQKTLEQAHAYGVMAMALAEKDPSAARRLLQEGLQQLQSMAFRADQRQVFPIALTLANYAETVDPEHTRDYFWQAVAMHPGPAVEVWSPDERLSRQQENTAQLVILLALYDQFPELRRELMAPIFEHWGRYDKGRDFYRQSAAFTAMALTDPERAIAWHNDFYPKLNKEDRSLIPQPWTTLADVFANDGEDLAKTIAAEVFSMWTIDKEDL
jgi:hypothetical protein